MPCFAPIGLGFWQIAVALIAGISAKEVVVSSCAVLFGVPNINSGAGMDTLVGIDGVLSAVYSLCGGIGNDTERVGQYPVDAVIRPVSVSSSMDCDICYLSYWNFNVR